MIVHIVMIKFKDEFKDKAKQIKLDLENLINQIDCLKKMEVGLNFTKSDRAMDLVLVSEFDDEKGLEEYRVHPAHQKVLEDIKKYAEFTKVVDYKK